MKKNFKIAVVLALVLAFAMCMAGCTKLAEIKLPDEVVGVEGETISLVPEFVTVPEDEIEERDALIADLKLKWTSSDETVAMVGSDGVVKLLKTGIADITVASEKWKLKTTVSIVVNPKEEEEKPIVNSEPAETPAEDVTTEPESEEQEVDEEAPPEEVVEDKNASSSTAAESVNGGKDKVVESKPVESKPVEKTPAAPAESVAEPAPVEPAPAPAPAPAAPQCGDIGHTVPGMCPVCGAFVPTPEQAEAHLHGIGVGSGYTIDGTKIPDSKPADMSDYEWNEMKGNETIVDYFDPHKNYLDSQFEESYDWM